MPGREYTAGSNWLEEWYVVHVGYLISQSALCQLAMSKRKSYCVSSKLKALETAEKKSKESRSERIWHGS